MRYITDTIALKKLMVEKGISTNTALAEAANTDRTTVGKVLNGKTQPSAELMGKLASALEMDSATAGAIFFKPKLT